MISIAAHHMYKQRGFLSVVTVAASLLFMSATLIGLFSPAIAYGAGSTHQQTGLGKGLDIQFTFPRTSVPSPHVDFYVFFTRPLSCAQDPTNCNGNVKLYAPDNKVQQCTSPVPQAMTSSSKPSSLAWVTNGEACPYLNCNWMPMQKGCSALTTNTTFQQSPPSLSALGNVYMKQSMDFSSAGGNGDYGFSGCIYWENWPEWELHNTQVLVSGSKIQLTTTGSLVSAPLPSNISLQTIQTALASLPSQPSTTAGSRSSTAPGTWNG